MHFSDYKNNVVCNHFEKNGSVKKIIKMICNLTSLLIQMLITHICICIKLLPLYVNLETCH